MHVAIIMDGNGRWATGRGLPRTAGHEAGARTVRRIVEAAARGPIDTLSLYAFSSANWARPSGEVAHLMSLLERYLTGETERCVRNGVRVSVIGRRDRLSLGLRKAIECTEALTRGGTQLNLRLAVDYSSRDSILRAAMDFAPQDAPDTFVTRLACDGADVPGVHEVDLLIRTGGEQRLSDFLLWESAYAELVFVDECWPDFDEAALNRAMECYRRRERRFGALESATECERLQSVRR